MFPVLLEIGPVTVYSYGVMVAVAFLVAAALASKRASLFNVSSEFISSLAIVVLISGVVGARILYVLDNLNYFSAHAREIFFINKGGLVFYGGFISAFVIGLIYTRFKKASIPDTADLVAPFVILAHSIGRIGCLLNGCCYGRVIPDNLKNLPIFKSLAVYPTQLMSSVGLFLMFLVLLRTQKKRRFPGQVFLVYLIIYGTFRLLIEFLRADLISVLYIFTLTQLISIVCVVVGSLLYIVYRTK